MQTTADLIGAVIELAARADFGHDHFERRNAFCFVDADRDTDTIIRNRHDIIVVKRHKNVIASSSQRFINGVVNDFVNQMMKRSCIRSADIHTGAQTHVLHRVQLDNVAFIVCFCRNGSSNFLNNSNSS